MERAKSVFLEGSEHYAKATEGTKCKQMVGQECLLPFVSAPVRALSPAEVKMKTRLGLISLEFIHLKIRRFNLVCASQAGSPPLSVERCKHWPSTLI